jgi:GPN-loop GTPase
MFGQLVIGPCGSGKSTYCNGMAQLMTELKRPVAIVNLDPSNDSLVYDCAVNIRDLVDSDAAAIENDLGPNGTQLYCLDVLASRIDWLEERLRPLKDHYVLFDCPGQFELYTDSDSMKTIVNCLTKTLKAQLVAVTLIDCLLCTSPHSFVSAVLLSLSMMIHLELPHVNILSKMDTMRRMSPEMAFSLEYYLKAGGGDLESLILKLFPESSEPVHPLDAKYADFIRSISDVSEQFSLVGFTPLAIEDKESAIHALSVCDKANGYTYSAEGFHLMEESQKADTTPEGEFYTELEEKFKSGPYCTACGADSHGGETLLRCTACKKAQYCNRECQKADWKYHKNVCTYKQGSY